ncbi:MAG: hypothetical protein JXR70_19655 [Spirochaetales bacterium]|nr:hypothetical protein [Spirochaetales bacterium]
MNIKNSLVENIKRIAQVPSFSTFEDRLHPVVTEFIGNLPHWKGRIQAVADNNLVIHYQGQKKGRPPAFTAHLDKINHWGRKYPQTLDFEFKNGQLVAQLDDAAGVGLLLTLVEKAADLELPEFYLYFSEVEENISYKVDRNLLRDKGLGLYSGIGADRISQNIIFNKEEPAYCLTVDTTPVFKGQSGVALYSAFWEKSEFSPSDELIHLTGYIRDAILKAFPFVQSSNNTNDYIDYGLSFNSKNGTVPSLALEPGIFPYHQKIEGVYLEDLEKCFDILVFLLKEVEI